MKLYIGFILIFYNINIFTITPSVSSTTSPFIFSKKINIRNDQTYEKEDLRNCFNNAGKNYNVDPILLYSIAKKESNFNPWAMNRNKNGSRDIGIMQINSSWLPSLKSSGINERSLYRPCLNIYLGAYVLAKAIEKNGNNWNAVGAYNAGSAMGERHERNRFRYAKSVYSYYVALKLQLSTKQKQKSENRIANYNG